MKQSWHDMNELIYSPGVFLKALYLKAARSVFIDTGDKYFEKNKISDFKCAYFNALKQSIPEMQKNCR